MSHDQFCENGIYISGGCDCAGRAADANRIQAENRGRLDAANDAERDDVLRWLNDFHPDVLRDAMNETGSNR